MSYIPGHGPTTLDAISDPVQRFLDALYFSVITGATVGYGDILPLGISRFFAALEGIVSFVLLAVFVSKLASRKQDAAILHIQSLSEDASFNNIRHGLFVARKDLDVLIKKVHERGEQLSDKDWRNLRTAFRQMQIFIRNIPHFYTARRHQGGIDADREQLLLDSVDRTLRRVTEALDLFLTKDTPVRQTVGVCQSYSR